MFAFNYFCPFVPLFNSSGRVRRLLPTQVPFSQSVAFHRTKRQSLFRVSKPPLTNHGTPSCCILVDDDKLFILNNLQAVVMLEKRGWRTKWHPRVESVEKLGFGDNRDWLFQEMSRVFPPTILGPWRHDFPCGRRTSKLSQWLGIICASIT